MSLGTNLLKMGNVFISGAQYQKGQTCGEVQQPNRCHNPGEDPCSETHRTVYFGNDAQTLANLLSYKMNRRWLSTTLLFTQRSISFRTEARPLPPAPLRSRTKASSFPRRRNSQCWSDTVESHNLTAKEIKRQEVLQCRSAAET